MRSAAPVDLLLALDRGADAPEGLTRQIYARLRAAILAGRLRAEDRLPPTREMARDLGVARLTVATAYEGLRAEGYVRGRVGAGTFVAPRLGGEPARATTTLSAGLDLAATPTGDVSATDAEYARLSAWGRGLANLADGGVGSTPPAPYNMRAGSGAADAFPWARWRRVVGWLDAGGHEAGAIEAGSGEVSALVAPGSRWEGLLGPPGARAAIAAWRRRSRGLRCEPGQVLIAGGVQQVISLLARLLLDPGDHALVEDPSYAAFHAAFVGEGAHVIGAAVDRQGLVMDALPGTDHPAPRLALVTPSHQYPTGVTLPLDRRLALLAWARRAGTVIVEDDYDGELRLEGQPLEALQGLDTGGAVVYVGTFAKALYPAVRLAFAVLPPWLVVPAVRARAVGDRHPTWHDAVQVARFIEAGELERHLARVRRLYRARRDALVAALRAELSGLVTIGRAEAGIHLCAGLPSGVDDVALAREALAAGIGLSPLSPYYLAAPRPGLLLGFGAMPEERLAEAVHRLAPLVRARVERAARGEAQAAGG